MSDVRCEMEDGSGGPGVPALHKHRSVRTPQPQTSRAAISKWMCLRCGNDFETTGPAPPQEPRASPLGRPPSRHRPVVRSRGRGPHHPGGRTARRGEPHEHLPALGRPGGAPGRRGRHPPRTGLTAGRHRNPARRPEGLGRSGRREHPHPEGRLLIRAVALSMPGSATAQGSAHSSSSAAWLPSSASATAPPPAASSPTPRPDPRPARRAAVPAGDLRHRTAGLRLPGSPRGPPPRRPGHTPAILSRVRPSVQGSRRRTASAAMSSSRRPLL